MSSSKRFRSKLDNSTTSLQTSNGKFCDIMYPKHISFTDIVFNKIFLLKILLYLNLFDTFGIGKVSNYFCMYFQYERWRSESKL